MKQYTGMWNNRIKVSKIWLSKPNEMIRERNESCFIWAYGWQHYKMRNGKWGRNLILKNSIKGEILEGKNKKAPESTNLNCSKDKKRVCGEKWGHWKYADPLYKRNLFREQVFFPPLRYYGMLCCIEVHLAAVDYWFLCLSPTAGPHTQCLTRLGLLRHTYLSAAAPRMKTCLIALRLSAACRQPSV